MADEQKPEGGVSPSQQPSEPATPPPKAAPPKPAPAAPKAPAVMAVTPWESELARQLKEHFGDRITGCFSYVGQNFLVVAPDAAIPILEYLKLETDFDYLVDIVVVDYPKRAERFDLIYVVYSFARNERIRIKIMIPDGFQPRTAYDVHLTANWIEREVFDMFGIRFAGHPDLRRILMPDEWEGHPLRKDYSIIRQDERWVKESLGIESAQ